MTVRPSSADWFYVHPSAVVEEGACIGKGTRIWHFSHVMPGAVIGENCILGMNVYVDNGAVIGNRVKIQNNVSVYNGVEIQDDVFCGPSAVFTNVINPRAFIERKEEFRTTVVETGASIGANATIVCGNRIGCFAFVGAGSVVTRCVPPYALMLGVPARRVGWVCRCGLRLKRRAHLFLCPGCGQNYREEERRLVPGGEGS